MPRAPEIEHRYGDNIHILDDPLALTLLAKLCSAETHQPKINRLVAALYRQMVCTVIAAEMPTRAVTLPTRMIEHTPRAVWQGLIVDPALRVTVVCVARAGIFPSQVCFDFLNEIIDPAGVRQDHMLMGRTTDETGQIKGAAIHGAKIGGGVEGATMLIPDPMGATGTTIDTVASYYAEQVEGRPAHVIALNLIITPEYIRRIQRSRPDTIIYAYRVDRGLSSEEVLAAVPGERWDEERGLDEHGYIVPGGGGFGEIMNNAFV
jgi:uracil phosphoribosyltransferase